MTKRAPVHRPNLPTLKSRTGTAETQRLAALTATPRQRGRKWMERRARWLSEHPLCEHCQARGRVTAAEQVDHVVPLFKGGADDESNYQSMCGPCHKDKTARDKGHRVPRRIGLDGYPLP